MPLGKKAHNTSMDILLYQNMAVQRYLCRSVMLHVDMSNLLTIMNEYNKGKDASQKIRVPAILMKAIALAYDYTDENGRKPYRRFSGYFSLLPWGGSWESSTIDITLLIVRELGGVKDQTCYFVFREVEKKSVIDLSNEIFKAASDPEDEIPILAFMKKIASLPPVLTYFLLKLTRIPRIRALMVAPTSVAVMKEDVSWYNGEHTSYFGMARIDENNRAFLQWTYDHRLGLGKDIAPFIARVKQLLETCNFLEGDIRAGDGGELYSFKLPERVLETAGPENPALPKKNTRKKAASIEKGLQ